MNTNTRDDRPIALRMTHADRTTVWHHGVPIGTVVRTEGGFFRVIISIMDGPGYGGTGPFPNPEAAETWLKADADSKTDGNGGIKAPRPWPGGSVFLPGEPMSIVHAANATGFTPAVDTALNVGGNPGAVVVGFVVVEKKFRHTQGSEFAAWFTTMDVAPGVYPVKRYPGPSTHAMETLYVCFNGRLTNENRASYFGGVQVGKAPEPRIGLPVTGHIMTHRKKVVNDPLWTYIPAPAEVPWPVVQGAMTNAWFHGWDDGDGTAYVPTAGGVWTGKGMEGLAGALIAATVTTVTDHIGVTEGFHTWAKPEALRESEGEKEMEPRFAWYGFATGGPSVFTERCRSGSGRKNWYRIRTA